MPQKKWKNIKILVTQYKIMNELTKELEKSSVGTVHFYNTLDYIINTSSITHTFKIA